MAVASFVRDLQAGYLGVATLLRQFGSGGSFRLSVHLGDFQGQATHFLAHLDAKRAGLVLVQGECAARLVHRILSGSGTHHALGTRQGLLEQHHGAQNNAQGLEKESNKIFHGPF